MRKGQFIAVLRMDGMDVKMNHSTMHMNEMYFHFSSTVYHLLFKPWNVRSDGDLAWAVVFSFVLAIIYEGLKTVRDLLAWRSHKWLKPRASYARHTSVSEKSTLVEVNPRRIIIPYRLFKLWSMRVVLSVLRTIEIGMAYILMLLAMTYNGWIFLSVCIGTGMGYLIFIHFRSMNHDSNNHEHCG